MDLLIDYNSNLYIKICSFLNQELENLNSFISDIRNTRTYHKLLNLDVIYREIFSSPVLNHSIELNIQRVLDPHYSLFADIEPMQGNSTFFISIKLESKSLEQIDLIYDKQLTSLLRLFKRIFSIIDKPSHTIQQDDLIKYENLIGDINDKMKQFLLSSDNKVMIETRERLTINFIKNLPHNGFYHMTHADNLESILQNGLASHNIVHKTRMIKVDISNQAIQNQRNREETVFGRNIQDYVPLYINPQNPMMDSDKVKEYKSNIVLLEVIPHVLVQEKDTLFSDGNAAEDKTSFYHNQDEMENINWQLLQEGKWIKGKESYRIMCSEVLVPDKIEVFYLNKIILKDDLILESIMKLFPNHKGIDIEINGEYFETSRLN